MRITQTPPNTCYDCGCAAAECECWDRPSRPEEVILRANHVLSLLKQAEEKKPAVPTLKVGMWARIASGAFWRAEGRIASVGREYVRLQQLNGTILTVPREAVETAQFGTDWASLIEGGQ
jgi:hypothetical protein